MGAIGLVVSDFVISFMWVWSGVLVDICVFRMLGFHYDVIGEIVKLFFTILNLFIFSLLANITKGGAFNPLIILASMVSTLSKGLRRLLFTVCARILAQVLGSICGVTLIMHLFPEISQGTTLRVSIHHGALTEGLLMFISVCITLSLERSFPGSFVRKTWISNITKMALHILGSDLTGGWMNSASATGWAYARGEHLSRDHILVYWIAPLVGTLLAMWIFRFLFLKPLQKTDAKKKSE